ncbi:TIGR03915 family putative DNA repair protein [Azotosporobacter soli]|uniref:TIGR03915 family putative DNA repair protein n=1 Tax=Azotosporobacter soli TaxID=3055040 RepID=UPI0031FEBE12
MQVRSEVTYRYDGSFEGLLCCVFESYDKKEIPADILLDAAPAGLLFRDRTIVTESDKAQRVLASIPQKMGRDALFFIRQAFLTCLPQKEVQLLRFMRLGYQHGPAVLQMLTDETVSRLMKAVRHLERESHLLKGFIRFSITDNVLTAQIEAKNIVLPLLAEHFCQRFPEERFLIHDRSHGMALIYQPYRPMIIAVDEWEMPQADETELAYRKLWRLFYDSIEIKARHNPRCRMTQMPKRYWKYMTEFAAENSAPQREIGERKKMNAQRLLPPSQA